MSKKIKVIKIEAGKAPQVVTINSGLKSLQHEVEGYIECIYPWEEEVCIVCNEEGKISGLPLNRALYGEDGEMYDIIAGSFLIVGLTENSFEDSFCSLTEEEIEKFCKLFQRPEYFVSVDGRIKVVRL